MAQALISCSHRQSDKSSLQSTRRNFVGGVLALTAAGIVGLRSPPAQAVVPLLIRALTFSGARVGVSGTFNRTVVSGRAFVRPRPSQSTYTRTNYTLSANLSTGVSFNWENARRIKYVDEDEYHWESRRYPEYFAELPAHFFVDNTAYERLLLPYIDVGLEFEDGHVWHAYTLPDVCVPYGPVRFDLPLDRIPLGWAVRGHVCTPYGCATSNNIYL
jgi:hypothetical protein